MVRLIDAEEAKKHARTHIENPYSIMAACASIDSTPTIDAVPVVRCGECRYYEPSKCIRGRCNHPSTGLFEILKQTDFCSHGERLKGSK